MNSPLISVVVTVYNEEDNVRPLLEQLHAALASLDYELVYVDDGSRDNTIAELRAAGRHAEADQALAAFRRDYPDYRIDPAVWDKVKSP